MVKKHEGQNKFGDRSNEICHMYNRLIGICINDENNYSDRIVVMVNSLNEVFLFIRFYRTNTISIILILKGIIINSKVNHQYIPSLYNKVIVIIYLYPRVILML